MLFSLWSLTLFEHEAGSTFAKLGAPFRYGFTLWKALEWLFGGRHGRF